MSTTLQRKQEIIRDYAVNEQDVGSSEVQVAVLTQRIRNLTIHLGIHKKDFHTRRGLLAMVGKRRRLLDYLKNISETRYQSLIGRLELRK
ncbi:MAG: 30S ribosomal protein S15 [Holosporales bacterium]|jgi:small subunit ribosomal protein S15|nr:30S ribosomal protein S15 [Holosporales bacterium]